MASEWPKKMEFMKDLQTCKCDHCHQFRRGYNQAIDNFMKVINEKAKIESSDNREHSPYDQEID